MYNVHPSEKLIHAFRQKPYQGCCPTQAEFLFIGLDANYAPNIEEQKIFSKIIEYHEDAISFWQKYNVHHPFLLDGYKGDGRKYHKEFSKIRLSCKDASRISFIELLHLPTTGRNDLKSSDLDKNHLQYIHKAIFSEHTKAVFISDAVFKLMKKTSIFSWMNEAKQKQNELKLKQQKLLSEAKAQERKNETRRKILLGAWVLNKFKNDESFKHQWADFEQFLSAESKTEENRQKDKELFNDLFKG